MSRFDTLHQGFQGVMSKVAVLLEVSKRPEMMEFAIQLPLKLIEFQEKIRSLSSASENADFEKHIFSGIREEIKKIYLTTAGLYPLAKEPKERTTIAEILQGLVQIQYALTTLEGATVEAQAQLPPTPPPSVSLRPSALALPPIPVSDSFPAPENAAEVSWQTPEEFSSTLENSSADAASPAAETPAADDFSNSSLDVPLDSFATPENAPGKIQAPNAKRIAFFRWLDRWGFGGFGVSLFIHVLLGVFLLTWVVARYTLSPYETPKEFATGAGGGAQGKDAKVYEHRVKMKLHQNPSKSMPRLVSRSSDSAVSLPEMPLSSFNLQKGGLQSGNLSKGLGGGSGGGIGSGMGVGVGGGRNMVAKWVMGIKMEAKKIAVYLDNSGSMVPFLESVKAEIYSQYPDADIFEINGVWTTVRENKIEGGRYYIPGTPTYGPYGGVRGSSRNPPVKKHNSLLSRVPAAKSRNSKEVVLKRWAEHFSSNGSIGGWMDIMLFEGYDALVFFSDFQDGVHQLGKDGSKIYEERISVTQDSRTNADKAWEREWLKRCSDREKGPRIYLFSIQVRPQDIWQQCAESSGGAVKMMPELRRDGNRGGGGSPTPRRISR